MTKPLESQAGGNAEDAAFSRLMWYAALIIGAALRLRHWSVQRSIWLDEASLLQNILRRSESGLLKPLDLSQNAPILYLLAVKECSRVFGTSEASLRLPALIGGLIALCLFGVLARRTLRPSPAVLATFLFAVLTPGVRYSAEVKQYSLDQAATLAITLLALDHLSDSCRRIWPIALTGAVAMFASYPAIFVVVPAGAVLVIRALQSQQSIGSWTAVLAAWIACFLVNYALFLRHGTHDQMLAEYWRSAFLPMPPRSFSDLSWGYNTLVHVFVNPSGFKAMAGLAATLAVVGLIESFRDTPYAATILSGPIALALAASMLHKYPFEDRLILFIVPACVLFCVRGWSDLTQGSAGVGRRARCVIAAALLLEPAYGGMREMMHPGELEELRPVLREVAAETQGQDTILIVGQAHAAFDYYRNFRDVGIWDGVKADIVLAEPQPTLPVPTCRRVWLVLSHYLPQSADSWRAALIAGGFEQKASIEHVGARALLFQK